MCVIKLARFPLRLQTRIFAYLWHAPDRLIWRSRHSHLPISGYNQNDKTDIKIIMPKYLFEAVVPWLTDAVRGVALTAGEYVKNRCQQFLSVGAGCGGKVRPWQNGRAWAPGRRCT